MSRGEIDRAAFVAALQACGALRFGTFTLTSGKTSSYYVDIKRAVTRPELLRMIGAAMAPYARRADRIAGVELGAVPIAAAVSLASRKPFLMVRKAAKEHGTKEDFEGELNRGDRVLFVEDVVTTGGTLRIAIDRLRAHAASADGGPAGPRDPGHGPGEPDPLPDPGAGRGEQPPTRAGRPCVLHPEGRDGPDLVHPVPRGRRDPRL